MYKYLFLAVFVSCVGVCSCSGQSPWKFRSDNYVGLDAGEAGGFAHMQSVNGFYKRPWFFGAGVGLDYYRYRSVPLFLSVRRDLLDLGGGTFLSVYVDGGVNVPWYKRDLTTYQQGFVVSSKFHAGIWGSAGLGYEWRLSAHSNKALLISAGYSLKKLTERLDGIGNGPCRSVACPLIYTQPQTYFYEYTNNTFLFLLGFRF